MPTDWMPFYVIGMAILGLLIGSFLNVCIYRIPRDISVVAPRSFCPECGAAIGWFDNIPLVSYFVLRGRCRPCGKAIGIRYPAVEAITATLFGLIAYRYGWRPVAAKWLLWEAILVVLFWTDFEEQILPDELTLGGSALGIAIACFIPVLGVLVDSLFPAWRPIWRSLLDVGLGVILLAAPIWLLGLLYEKIRRREGLGFGDVKLLVLFSTFLGFENGIFATMLGAVAGSVIGLIWCVATDRKLSESALPFGSFLCVGGAVIPVIFRLDLMRRP